MGRLDCRWVPSTLNYVCLTSSSTYLALKIYVLHMLYNVLTYACIAATWIHLIQLVQVVR